MNPRGAGRLGLGHDFFELSAFRVLEVFPAFLHLLNVGFSMLSEAPAKQDLIEADEVCVLTGLLVFPNWSLLFLVHFVPKAIIICTPKPTYLFRLC